MGEKLSRRWYWVLALAAGLAILATGLLTTARASAAAPISGGTVSSLAGKDTTGDGNTFLNAASGVFIDMRSSSGDFEVQTRQERGRATAIAVKVDDSGNFFAYDVALQKLCINTVPTDEQQPQCFEEDGELEGGQIVLSQVIANADPTIRVEKVGPMHTVTTAAGDKVIFEEKKTKGDKRTLDMWASSSPALAPGRQSGDISGLLGALDSDNEPDNDLLDRQGNVMTDVKAFIREWIVGEGESMFAMPQ